MTRDDAALFFAPKIDFGGTALLWFPDEKKKRVRFRTSARESLKKEGYDLLFADEATDALHADLSDLWLLKEALVAARPSLVLEYGAGYSTYMIAETLRRLGSDRMVSVELDQKWTEIAASRLTPELSAIVEFRSPRPAIALRDAFMPGLDWPNIKNPKPRSIGIATITFPELNDLSPDFIFVDGPPRGQVPGYEDSTTGETLAIIVSDPLAFVQKSKATVVVDGRSEQTVFIKHNLPAGYTSSINSVQRFSVFSPPH